MSELHPNSGDVIGIERRDGKMYLTVYLKEDGQTHRIRISHAMQVLLVQKVLEHLAGCARELAWVKAGHPVHEDEMG